MLITGFWEKKAGKTRFQTVRSYFSNVLLIFCYLKLPSNDTSIARVEGKDIREQRSGV